MKKIFLIMYMIGSIGTLSVQAQTSLPEYGYTLDGDFFIKETRVDKCGEATVNIEMQGLFNNKWLTNFNMQLEDKDGDMTTKEDRYYVYRSGNSYKSGSKVLFAIKINESTWFPDCDESVQERVDNKQGGHNLLMPPTDQIDF